MAVAQPTQATQTNFGDIVQRGVSNYQRAQAFEDQRRQAEIDRQNEFEDRYGLDESLFQLEDTEFRTVNDATTEALAQARDRYYDVYKALQKDPTNVDLKKRLGKIRNFVTTIGASHEKMAAMGEEYLKKVQEGTISGVDEENWREQIEAYDNGRIRVMMDADDNAQFVFYGDDGQIKNAVKYTELLRGNLLDKVDIRSEVSELVKGLGGYEKDTPDGMYIRTQKGYGIDQRNAANQWIDAQLEDEATMADLLNQVDGSKKREGFTEDEYNKVRQYLQTEIEGRYVQSETMKPDQAKITQYRVNNSGTQTALKGNVRLSPSKDADNQPLIDANNNVEFSVSRRNSTGAYEPIEIKTDNSDIFISTVKRDYEGRLYVEGSQRVKMEGSYKSPEEARKAANSQYSGLRRIIEDKDKRGSYYAIIDYNSSDETLINNLANQTNFGDYEGLRNEMDNIFYNTFDSDYEPFISMDVPTFENQQTPSKVTGTNGVTYE